MRKNYTVLQIHNYYQHAGGEDIVVKNERMMLEHGGNTVFLYARSNNEIASFLGKLKYLFSFVFSRKSYREVKKLIIENKIDIVHVHNTFPLITTAVYKAAHDLGVPVVQTLHNFRFLCPEAMYLKKGKICELCNQGVFCPAIRNKCYRDSRIQTLMAVLVLLHDRKREMYSYVDAYIALTEFNKAKYEKEFPWCRGKIFVKPNFVSNRLDFIEHDHRTVEEYIYIGRLSEEKGINVLLNAFYKMPNCRLSIVGSGPLEKFVKEFLSMRKMRNVVVLGQLQQEEVIKELAGKKALIVPSVCYETFGMSIIEAFACGVPVIGSKLENISTLVDENVNGLLFRAGDISDLIRQISYMESNQAVYSRLSVGARKTYTHNYKEELNYERLLDIYDMASQKPLETVSKS